LYCGIDWASDHHDIAVVNDDGQVVARGRVGNDAAGFAQALTLLAEAGDSAEHPIPVGIETDRGLWVAALRATGRVIYPINPLAASRYRARYALSGAKSDATDAVLLANIVRTDADAHRPLPADTNLAQAIRVLARAQQDAVWAHQQIGNQIRDLLKDFYPAALVALAELPSGGLARPDVHAILAAAPTPAAAAKLTPARLRRLLVKAGRRRDLDRDVERLHAVFTDTYLHQPAVVENAMGIQLGTLLRQFEAACAAADELAQAAINHFEQHLDAEIITSFPGLGKSGRCPGAGRDRRRLDPVRRRARVESLRRIGPDHPRQRQENRCDTPAYQKPAPSRGRGDLGAGIATRLTRSPPSLRCPPRRRRLEPPSPTTPVQQIPRPAAPLPANRPALQRTPGLYTPTPARGLTFNFLRCLSCRRMVQQSTGHP
jgi:hypothetical protein